MRINTNYSFARYPPRMAADFASGLEVYQQSTPSPALYAPTQGSVSAGRQGTPSESACARAGGSQQVNLGGSGVPVGGWICAHSGGLVVRLRFEGGYTRPTSSDYRFATTVWKP